MSSTSVSWCSGSGNWPLNVPPIRRAVRSSSLEQGCGDLAKADVPHGLDPGALLTVSDHLFVMVREPAKPARLCPGGIRGWAAQRVRRDVERDQEVPEVHGAAEERVGARVAARRRGRSPSSAASMRSLRRCSDGGASSFSPPALSACSGKAERTEADELRRQVRQLERALGRKTLEVEVAGELLRMS